MCIGTAYAYPGLAKREEGRLEGVGLKKPRKKKSILGKLVFRPLKETEIAANLHLKRLAVDWENEMRRDWGGGISIALRRFYTITRVRR